MPIISIADRLLGSLMGTYLGHSYADQPWDCPDTKDSLLYQSWLDDTQQNIIPGPTLADFSPAVPLPWLLSHHDNVHTRHNWLIHNLAPLHSTDPGLVTEAVGVLYILGDSLEWLMQCPQSVQHPRPLLCNHLQHQLSAYPTDVSTQVTPLIEWLASESSLTGPVPPDIPMAATALALRQCLNYRENLALALRSEPMSQPTPAIIGCLLGAWGGTAVIPTPWKMALPPKSRKALSYMAEHLYRNWAGIIGVAGTCETLPPDL